MFKTFSESVKEQGQVSSKRVVTIVSLLLLSFCVLIDTFTPFKVSVHIFDGLKWIVLAGMGFISSERFSLNK
jgi:hypothetical protein